MKWSKLKKLTQDRFDDSLKGRVTLNSTRMGIAPADTHGYVWMGQLSLTSARGRTGTESTMITNKNVTGTQ